MSDYGLPYRCPKCPRRHAYGMLKVPGTKLHPCPNCGSALVLAKKLPVDATSEPYSVPRTARLP